MTYLSIQLLVYIATQAPVHQPTSSFFPFGLTCALTCELICWSMYPKDLPTPKYMYLLILILSFRQTTKTYWSTQPRATVFHPTCSFWSLHSDRPLIPTCPLTYYTTYPPPHQIISLHVHFNFSRQCRSSGLPINSSAGPRTQRRTRKWTYLFILMAHFRLITKTYVSNQLVVYLSMDAPFPQNHLFISMLSFRLTTNTYFSIQLFVYMPKDEPVHFDAFIPANHKYLHPHRWTCSPTYLRIFIFSFRLTLPVHFALALHIYTDLPVHQDIPIEFSLPFRQSTQNYMSTHLLVYLPRDAP